MSEKTNISWADHTFNIAWGCEKVSPGCANCYADSLALRYGWDIWGHGKSRRTFTDHHWKEPIQWNIKAASEGKRRRVFCSSMCDIFEAHPTIDAERTKLWPLIQETPWLDWQLLTKRAERIASCLPGDWDNGYPNVWLGVSAENQEWADKRVPHLLSVPAKARFLSVEPMLGPIELENVFWRLPEPLCDGCPKDADCDCGFNTAKQNGLPSIDWVIIGGESGPKHRQCDPGWIYNVIQQCRPAGIACFVKQDSGPKPGCQGRLSDALFGTKEFPCGEQPQVDCTPSMEGR